MTKPTKMTRLLFFIFILCLGACSHAPRATPAQKSARMSLVQVDQTETIFYLTTPNRKHFPIAVLCEGSTMPDDVESVWSLHQFEQFSTLQEMGLAILTVEKDGIDADKIDRARFFANYTRSRRLRDHVAVIDHLLKNPPRGFDGRLIFIGASEGGPLVNQLSIHYPQTVATINWSGASDWPWPDELWAWADQQRKEHPILAVLYGWWHKIPKDRGCFDDIMAETVREPSDKRWFLGMTHRYHADAIRTPLFPYEKIHAPMLVVCGTKDSIINSCDAFVKKAQDANATVTYWRVEGMEHRISQNKQDIIPKSFTWLSEKLSNGRK